MDNGLLISSLFGKKFLAIWGIGNTSYRFVEKNRWLLNAEILFLDNNNKEKIYFDSEVKNPSEIINWKDIFIIVASIYYEEIKNQLESYGLKEKKDFISYNKFDLFFYSNLKSHPDKQKIKKIVRDERWTYNFEDLYEQISSASIKTVCFQMENVLMLGDVGKIYKLLEKKSKISGFAMLRKHGNDIVAYRKVMEEYVADVDEIYEIVAEFLGISKEIANQLKQEEETRLKKIVKQRKSIKAVYDYAVNQGKEIRIFSSAPYSKEIIEEILRLCGYANYSELYQRKDFCTTDEFLSALFEKNKESCIYVGKSYVTYIKKQSEYDIKTFYIPTPKEAMISAAKLNEFMDYQSKNVDNSLIYDFIIDELFDDPFVEYDIESLFNGQMKNMGLVLFAPIILEFTIWFFQKVIEDNTEQIVWVYRDGYLLEKIFGIIQKYYGGDFKSKRLFLSRTIRYGANYSLIDALQQNPVNQTMTIEDFVVQRLLVNNESEKQKLLLYIDKYTGKKAADTVQNMSEIMSIYPVINRFYTNTAEKNLKTIVNYCKSVIGNSERTAVFDIGYRGSVVNFLYEKAGVVTKGYHIFKSNTLQHNTFGYKNTEGFIQYGRDIDRDLIVLRAMFEDIISIQEGTAIAVNEKDNGEYEIVKEQITGENIFVDNIQNIILKFSERFIEVYSDYLLVLDFDVYNDFDLVLEFVKKPYLNDAMLIKNMDFIESEFRNGSLKNNLYCNWFFDKVSP